LSHLKIIRCDTINPGAPAEERFNELYVALRGKEGRMYTDREVARLPDIAPSHAYFKEWKIRKRSCQRLLRYIKNNRRLSTILEVGCGNGWLSGRLAGAARGKVTGIDINGAELAQARRVFGKISNLDFVDGDIRSGILREKKYDLVVFAASIQYFSSLGEIIEAAMQHLTLCGEIHLLDSPLYRFNEIAEARHRSRKYFAEAGFSKMANHYFHHGMEDLTPFCFAVLDNPHSLKNKLLFSKNPFYWVVIKNR
jgi:SAM-dependent methyltransferase